MTLYLTTRLSSHMVKPLIASLLAGMLCAGWARAGEKPLVETGDPAPKAGASEKPKPKPKPKDKDKDKDAKEKEREKEKQRKLRAEIAGLIKQLGDEKYSVRVSAEKRLTAIGKPAAPALMTASGSKDLEVSIRAKAILKEVVGVGWLGVEIRDPDARDRKGRKLPEGAGAMTVRVLAGTPAADAKLVVGDFVYSLDGQVIKDSANLTEVVGRTWPGTKSKMVLYRNNVKMEVKVVIGRRPKAYERPGE